MFGRNLYLDIIFFLEKMFGRTYLSYSWPCYHNVHFNLLRNFTILYTLLLPTVWGASPIPILSVIYTIWVFAHIIVVTDAYSLWPTRDKKQFFENVRIQRENLKHEDPRIRKAVLMGISHRKFDKKFRNLLTCLQFFAFLFSACVIIFGADVTIKTCLMLLFYGWL